MVSKGLALWRVQGRALAFLPLSPRHATCHIRTRAVLTRAGTPTGTDVTAAGDRTTARAGLAAAALLLCAAVALPALPQAPSVTVAAAARGTLVERVTLTGTAVAREEAMVVPQIDGLAVTAVLAEEGDRVAQGQVLARLSREAVDASLAQNAAQIAHAEASIAQAQGQIAEAVANQVQADAAYARTRELIGRGDASRETFEQRQAAQSVAAARVAAAQDALGLARADRALAEAQRQELSVRLARTELRAPVAGLVSRRMARVGAVVGVASEPLFRLVTGGTVEMEAAVPEALLARLRVGQAAALFVAGTQRPGRVRLISPEVSATTRLGRVRISLDPDGAAPAPQPAARPAPPPAPGAAASALPATGSFVRAEVEVARRDGVLVPLSALLFQVDGPHVALVAQSPDGPVVRVRAVSVGLRDDSRAELDDGVAAGDRVVTLSGTFLRDGDRVTPVAAQVAAGTVPPAGATAPDDAVPGAAAPTLAATTGTGR
jgi:HlyD family secretion protein